MSKSKFVDPNLIHAQLMEAVGFQQSGRLEDAQAAYKRILGVQPKHFDALHMLGVIAAQQRNFFEAVELISGAIKVNPNNAAAHYNLGYALEDLKRYRAAVSAYDKAIKLKPDHFVAYNNRGVALSALTQNEAAVESFDAALKLNSSYAEAHYNRGIALSDLDRYAEAIESFDTALRLRPGYDFAQGLRLYTQAGLCNWDGFDAAIAQISERLARGEKAIPPWPALVLLDAPALQRKAAELWVAERHSAPAPPLAPARVAARKIRVGYFSMDFRNHPVSVLMAGVLEAHNRDQFEIYGFSYGANTQDAMRARVQKACDVFLDVADRSEHHIATLARARKIDIAIDLAGYTTRARTEIFAQRAAPIQVNYLGYPGTLGASFMDYIIADTTVIPESERAHYVEKIVYMPHSYQANDRQRATTDKIYSREYFGLPAQGFVFCCFNNNRKFTPTVFDSWMRILKQIEGSVLWLFEEHPSVSVNLRREAELRGVDATRLIFAGRVDQGEHLARHKVADLFIDSLPYNAHTTASDALWMGLPVVTRMGASFAARVAASLLRAVDLPELITTSVEGYEALAIDLANAAERLSAIKHKLAQNLLTAPLFDAPLFARHLEAAYLQMMKHHNADENPQDIHVARLG